MIQASFAAFLGSYFSVFYAPCLDLFWALILLALIALVLKKAIALKTVFVALMFFLWTQAAIQWQLDSRYDIPYKTTVTLDVEIVALPAHKLNSISFLVQPIKRVNSEVDFDFLKLKRIRVNWYRSTQKLKGGQIWRMTLRLQPPHGYQNDGGFDYERWMFSERISATAYVISKVKPVLLGESSNLVLKTRSWLSQNIASHAKGLEYLSLFQTLSIGDKTLLAPSLKQLFVQTGTAHLLVISGLHVGLLSLMFYFLASRFWVVINRRVKTRLNQKSFAAICALSAAFTYAALAGFSLPTIRALLMLSLIYLAFFRRQNTQFLDVFCFALILVLLLQPLALLSFSFWLSFIAILLIVVSQYVLKNTSKLKALLLLQLLFSILFIPLNVIVFKQWVVSSFFANLLLIPVMSFVVIPLNLLATFLSAIDWSGSYYLYQFLNSIIAVLVQYLEWLEYFFGEPVPVGEYSVWLMLISAVGTIIFLFVKPIHIKFPAFFIMVVPWFYGQNTLSQGDVKAYFFDVGMGTSVLIKTKTHSLLYDLGPGNKTTYQPAKWVIKPYLTLKGINRLDKTIISHSDQDHYGGVWPLVEDGLITKQLYSGSKKKMTALLPTEITVMDCHSTQSWQWDGVHFKFLPLKSFNLDGDNNQSCVLKISSPYGSVLLAGDIEHEREQELLELYKNELKSDMLLVPHHGSKTSSSELFLQAVKPKYAVVTTGYLNHWGFPKSEVMARYDALDVTWLNTGVVGSVAFNMTKKGLSFISYRDKHKAHWN